MRDALLLVALAVIIAGAVSLWFWWTAPTYAAPYRQCGRSDVCPCLPRSDIADRALVNAKPRCEAVFALVMCAPNCQNVSLGKLGCW